MPLKPGEGFEATIGLLFLQVTRSVTDEILLWCPTFSDALTASWKHALFGHTAVNRRQWGPWSRPILEAENIVPFFLWHQSPDSNAGISTSMNQLFVLIRTLQNRNKVCVVMT